MFNGKQYRDELILRLDTVRRILRATHSATADAPDAEDAGREARGLAIVLLFASYENLMMSLCRGLLEVAKSLRVGNRRLRKGFRLFAVFNQFQSISDSSEGKIWQERGGRLLESAFDPKKCTIDTTLFPHDGSFMKCSQVALFCDIFELGDPGQILREVWNRLDTIVIERNGIAHGRLTPEEVGRSYSLADIQNLVNVWQERWCSFIEHVEGLANQRNFYRYER